MKYPDARTGAKKLLILLFERFPLGLLYLLQRSNKDLNSYSSSFIYYYYFSDSNLVI